MVCSERFLARQAILDAKGEVYAYELLFRDGPSNAFPGIDGNIATARVLTDSFLVFGIEELTGRTRAFVNFPKDLLVDGRALLLPPDKIVVEILETVAPEPEVLDACRELRRRGYTLALDDFEIRPEKEPLLDLAHIVKIDIRSVEAAQHPPLARYLHAHGVIPLAERVETPEQQRMCRELGYKLFQGYFFQKPTLLSQKDMPTHKIHYLRILRELNTAEPDSEKLASLIQQDVSLSVKLLRYINSASVGLRKPVASIKQALWVLGERELRRWVSLLSMAELASDRPSELLATALVRAKLAELLALRTNGRHRAPDYFLLGLLSLLDAMLDQPMEKVLGQLPLAPEISTALLGRPSPMTDTYSLVLAMEQARWPDVDRGILRLGLTQDDLPPLQVEALKFGDLLRLGGFGNGDADEGERGRAA